MHRPLPDLSGIYPITEAMHREFTERGYIHLRGVCPPSELAPYAEILRDEALAAFPDDPFNQPLQKPYFRAQNLWRRSGEAAQFVLARRFGRIAAELLGARSVRLWLDQALFKEPGAPMTPWHRDEFPGLPPGCRTVTMWMPLVFIPAEMMAMKLVPHSHLQSPPSARQDHEDEEDYWTRWIHQGRLVVHQIQEMMPGDATFHLGRTLHGAPANRTSRTREVMTAAFFEDFCQPGAPGPRLEEREDSGPGPRIPLETNLHPLVYR